MFRSYLLLLSRLLLKKEKLVLLISTVGAAICISSFILLTWYAHYEESYDGFFKNSKDIYRLQEAITNRSVAGQTDQLPIIPGRLTKLIRKQLPEVQSISWISPKFGCSLKAVDKKEVLYSEKTFLADSCFFNVFSVPFLEGSGENALDSNFSAVISASLAKKLFGDRSPMNKQVKMTWGFFADVYTIKGVFKDIPANSHLALDMLFSNRDMALQQLDWHYHYTYVLFKKGADVPAARDKIQHIYNESYRQYMVAKNVTVELSMRPIMDIHLHTDTEREIKDAGDYRIFLLIKILSIATLVVFAINYVNLTSSLYARRIKELQMRITMGATAGGLFRQFLFENCLQLSLGTMIAVGLLLLYIPFFDRTFHLQADPGSLFSTGSIGILLCVMAGISVAASLAAMLLIARTRKPARSPRMNWLWSFKNIFLGIQYLFVGCIIFSTLVIEGQVNFMKRSDLGFDKSRVIFMTTPPLHMTDMEKIAKVNYFIDEVKRIPGVENATNSLTVPGRYYNNLRTFTREDTTKVNCVGYMANADFNYLDTYKLRLLAGRDFYKDYSDNHSMIINETLCKGLHFQSPEEAIGKRVMLNDSIFSIVGVIADNHQNSFKYLIQPWALVMVYKASSFISIRFDSRYSAATMEAVKKTFAATFPEAGFNCTFLDQYFDRLFIPDDMLSNIFLFFSLLMMILVSIGLLGISSFVVSQRIKEIAIRKVLGAGIFRNFGLIAKDYVIINGLFLLLSLGLSYFMMSQWLQGFAYRADLGFQPFIIPLLITFPVTLIIVVYNVYKVEVSSSVKSLKSL